LDIWNPTERRWHEEIFPVVDTVKSMVSKWWKDMQLDITGQKNIHGIEYNFSQLSCFTLTSTVLRATTHTFTQNLKLNGTTCCDEFACMIKQCLNYLLSTIFSHCSSSYIHFEWKCLPRKWQNLEEIICVIIFFKYGNVVSIKIYEISQLQHNIPEKSRKNFVKLIGGNI
jgi:hypothetical protein